MKRVIHFLLLLFVFVCTASAQRYIVTGIAQEAKSKHAVEFATASLLNIDSTAIAATTTDENGFFRLQAKTAGKFIVKLSYVGYQPTTALVTLTADNDSINIGNLQMITNDNVLGTATVSVTAARVEQRDDTTVYNAAAYRVPEGSTLEALVKQLPGVEVSDDGTVKWNGKTVSEFLINGKDFFKGDTEVAMKNLPTDLVSQIKAYDKQSDYTEQTGIDDGEETTVLDIMTKRELNESWVTNLDVALGNHDRYYGRVFATRFTDNSRVTAFGQANNTNDQSFGGPRGMGGGGGNGLVATKNAGIDFTWDNGKKKREAGRFEIGGNVRYQHSNSDALSKTSSETFLTSGSTSSYSNSWSHNVSKNTNVNTSFRLQWNPDSMTNISFRPSYSYSESWNSGNSRTATFNDDPYSISGMTNPLDSIMAENAKLNNPELYAMMVNTNTRLSLGNSHSHNVSGNLNVVRRLNSNGRNVNLRLSGGYSTSESESFSISNITYNESSDNASSFLNQYTFTPSKNWNYSARLGYVEPLGGKWYGEVRYQFSYKYSDSDRSLYNLDSLFYSPYNSYWDGSYSSYGDPDNYPSIGSLPTADDVLTYIRDLNNSQYATYKYYNHSATLGVRYNTEEIRFNAGVDFNPEKTKMEYERPGQNIDTLITRNVFNVSPQVRFRYRFSKTENLDIRYRGSSSQPSMTNLLAVVDDSDPLNISMGNPGLKPSWNNSLRVNYNGYNPNRQQGIMGSLEFSQTRNSISNRIVYDETTGVKYTRPENINGNWDGRASFMFNTGLGAEKLFTISTFTNLSYNNSVGYVSVTEEDDDEVSTESTTLQTRADVGETTSNSSYNYYNAIFASASSEKNTTRTLGVSENLNLAYRATWWDISLLGQLNYQHARATVQDNANMDTWNFAYGASANFNFDFGLSISTDIRMNSRRGYSDETMNTNELLWNAQISQSFFQKKNLTLSIQFYDILHEQSNISRTLSASSRTDSWSNGINSYFMVHVIYKLNIFPSGSSGEGEGERQGPPDMRGPGGMPMPGGGGPGGGGPGGGRPM